MFAPSSKARTAGAQPNENASALDASRPVQLKGEGYAAQAASLAPDASNYDSQRSQLATSGLGGGASELPHLGAIQHSFGHHDVSGVRFHSGGDAQAANSALGSEAYATGSNVVSGGTTDLHTMAHEAAHVVQQRGGVQLKGGFGESGDKYEQHADAVADQVVQGKSAEGLLDQMAGGGSRGGGGDAVQLKDVRMSKAPDVGRLSKIPMDTVLHVLQETGGRFQVALPDGNKAWISASDCVEVDGDAPVVADDAPVVDDVEAAIVPPVRRAPVKVASKPQPAKQDLPKKKVAARRPLRKVSDRLERDVEVDDADSVDTPAATAGTLTVDRFPKVNEPSDGKPVFRGAADTMQVTLNGHKYQVQAGQNYLNTELSSNYKTSADEIRGTKPKLSKGFGGASNLLSLGDGHHRFVWAAFHGQSIDVDIDKKPAPGQSWAPMTYKPTPESMKLNPIVDLSDALSNEFYMAFVSPEPIFNKYRKSGTVDGFIQAFCKHKTLLCDPTSLGLLRDYITLRQGVNAVISFDEAVKELVDDAKDEATAAKYGTFLQEMKGYVGGRKPAVIMGSAVTTGYFSTIHNVITLDPSKMPTTDEQLDTLLFESQNALNRSALTRAKQQGGGHRTANVEFESDRMYLEGLLAIHKCADVIELVATLKIDEGLLEDADYASCLVAKKVPMPGRDAMPAQNERQALWWYKARSWSPEQRKAVWIKENHGEGVGASEDLY